jgi:integrase
MVSSVFNYARKERLTSLPNPAALLSEHGIESRDRFLQPDELPRFFAAVAESPLRDFFLLALLTGARRSNLQEMKWQDICLDDAVWRISNTNNETPQNVTLAPEAVEVLRERWDARRLGDTFVFPGPRKSGHLTEPKKAFASVLARAGIDNLRIHDLRRTLGSWQARQGASMAIIGKSLNHKSQQTTAIHARLDLDPVRQSVNSATAAMLEAGGVKLGAEILPFSRKRA